MPSSPKEEIIPLIHITLADPTGSDETVHRLQLETTRLMKDVLHKDATLSAAIGETAAPIHVALHEPPADAWGDDGRTQAARRAERRSGAE